MTMIDPFGRTISYLRLSVTDRCDFRCVYCMAEDMQFLPRAELLSLDELERVAHAFIRKGVRKIRLTGGEPLVRRNLMKLVNTLGAEVKAGRLEELTLTTNGSQLARFATEIATAGIKRINVSLDTLDASKFARITRFGQLDKVLLGIEAAKQAGLEIKINMVALKGVNDDELDRMIGWCGAEGFDLTLIEIMPMGELGAETRLDQYLPLRTVKRDLAARWQLAPSTHRTGGPARYFTIAETGRQLGFITPLTHNFCESCNRVRVTCTGQLFMCLGQEGSADLRMPLRAGESDQMLEAAIDGAIARKPKGHDFVIDRTHAGAAVSRHMSVTGG